MDGSQCQDNNGKFYSMLLLNFPKQLHMKRSLPSNSTPTTETSKKIKNNFENNMDDVDDPEIGTMNTNMAPTITTTSSVNLSTTKIRRGKSIDEIQTRSPRCPPSIVNPAEVRAYIEMHGSTPRFMSPDGAMIFRNISSDDGKSNHEFPQSPPPPPQKILLIFQDRCRSDLKQFHVNVTTEMRKCFEKYCSLTNQSTSNLLFFAAKRDTKRNLHHIGGTQTPQSLAFQNQDVITAFPKYVNINFKHSSTVKCNSVFRLRTSCTTSMTSAYESYAHCIQCSVDELHFTLLRQEADEVDIVITKHDNPVSLLLPDDHIVIVKTPGLSLIKKDTFKSRLYSRFCFFLLVLVVFTAAIQFVLLIDARSKLDDAIEGFERRTEEMNKVQMDYLRQRNQCILEQDGFKIQLNLCKWTI